MPRNYSKVTIGQFVLGWMKLRSDGSYTPTMLYARVLKRCLHFFAQRVEESFLHSATTQVPAPVKGKPHPFQKSCRAVGSSAILSKHLAGRFMVRGGGFVSVKEEKDLHSLGLFHKGSSIASRTASSFGALSLLKAATVTQDVLDRSPMPVINFCCDAARVFKLQA